MDEARKRISDISDFSVKLSEVLEFLVKDNLEFKNTVKKDNETLKGKIQQFITKILLIYTLLWI